MYVDIQTVKPADKHVDDVYQCLPVSSTGTSCIRKPITDKIASSQLATCNTINFFDRKASLLFFRDAHVRRLNQWSVLLSLPGGLYVDVGKRASAGRNEHYHCGCLDSRMLLVLVPQAERRRINSCLCGHVCVNRRHELVCLASRRRSGNIAAVSVVTIDHKWEFKPVVCV